MTNEYSSSWFEHFLRTIPAAQTLSEIEFIRRQIPDPPFRRILDLCCGEGRHAIPMARLGYDVTGVDTNEAALAVARQSSGSNARFMRRDMRELHLLAEPYDAVLCMWQSFGYFDDATNAAVLKQIAEIMSPGGRLILDVYNRDFFERHQGQRIIEKSGMKFTEHARMNGNRLSVVLTDQHGPSINSFDWQLFTPDELRDRGESCGLRILTACTSFDESKPPTGEHPRMQLVFERIKTAG